MSLDNGIVLPGITRESLMELSEIFPCPRSSPPSLMDHSRRKFSSYSFRELRLMTIACSDVVPVLLSSPSEKSNTKTRFIKSPILPTSYYYEIPSTVFNEARSTTSGATKSQHGMEARLKRLKRPNRRLSPRHIDLFLVSLIILDRLQD
jgi:hypothetical protein